MKGNAFGKCLYTACAVAGCMTGCWWYSEAKPNEVPNQISTNDNTLTGQAGDSVFFVQTKEKMEELFKNLGRELAELQKEQQETEVAEREVKPSKTEAIGTAKEPMQTEVAGIAKEPMQTELAEITQIPLEQPEVSAITKTEESRNAVQVSSKTQEEMGTPTESPASEPTVTVGSAELPSLAGRLAIGRKNNEPAPSLSGAPVLTGSASETPKTADATVENPEQTIETFTYPMEIFGQVPVINRSDAYMSYFEFCYDLINMLEPVVEQQGRSMNALLTRFAIKALFSGVDIEQLNINAPIPRRQAALVLWLAAELLSEQGTATSSKSAQSYVTDILGCSSSEKKAIAYLYEEGIISGYNTAGQKFYPDAGLKTESGNAWLLKIKQCWR